MKYSMIATWKMSYTGVQEACIQLKTGIQANDAVIHAVHRVEENEHFHSVGYSGLPNHEGIVQCDAGYMDGTTLQVGAVGALENVVHAVEVAKLCSKGRFNNILVGQGAYQFAFNNGFQKEDLSTEESYNLYLKRKNEDVLLNSYDGHDTVGILALDQYQHMCVATSTSGLFMKHPGRIGDSPLVGSGFYCDDEIGGACATGVGEEIMRGCLSYETVRRMNEGMSAQEAAQSTVFEWTNKMMRKKGYCDAISIISMDNQGNVGVGTNIKFAFCVGNDKQDVKVLVAIPNKDEIFIRDYDAKIDELD